MSEKNSNISQYLVRKAQEVATATESLMEVTQDWQLILEFMKNRIEGIKLTKKQHEKMRRYQFAYAQCSTGKFTDQEVMTLLRTEFENVGVSQAYEDMRCMREIYNVIGNINKRYEIHIQMQINRRMLIKAEEADDKIAYAMLEKNRILMMKELQVEEENPAENFKGHVYQPVFDVSLISDEQIDMKEVLRLINEKRGVKLNLSQISATDIPYESIEPTDPDLLQSSPDP
jgi:hypothetical protein